MKEKKVKSISPAEFYRIRRPEYFSDSTVLYEVELPREVLAFEISKISSYQKQDLFETLSRRLAEKFICPNLIPQVGPTGGGDGKTDSETYPVATLISDRWFVPENGWDKDQKWAFAFSAKEDWKGKLRVDVSKIIETGRGYTRVYFISNQIISSKKKKDAQDELTSEQDIDVVILDAEWILEKIYSNDIIDLAVESLNLSSSFSKRSVKLGSNDARRIKELEKIEADIASPNRYSTGDLQLIDDSIRAAILSRMIGKPRDETEGRFDRCERFCRHVSDPISLAKLAYQRAWTYINYFDEREIFETQFLRLREHVSKDCEAIILEWYFNLFNILRTSLLAEGKESVASVPLEVIESELLSILQARVADVTKPTTRLIAETYLALLALSSKDRTQKSIEKALSLFLEIIPNSVGSLDYPFEVTRSILLEIGGAFAKNKVYDQLIDELAIITEKRSSELAAGETFLRRGTHKLVAGQHKEGIVYFGKAIYKLAKEETQQAMRLALRGLAECYSNMELPWASYCCHVAENWINFKDWYETHIVTDRLVNGVMDLVTTELFLGRVPNFLVWYQLHSILGRQVQNQGTDDISRDQLTDACFSVRLLNTFGQEQRMSYLPKVLEEMGLFLSQNACLYILGHTADILSGYKSSAITTEEQLDNFFRLAANQPFRDQMVFETEFQDSVQLSISTTILGCRISIIHPGHTECMLIAEALMALLEGALGTSVGQLFPHSETLTIEIVMKNDVDVCHIQSNETKSIIILEFHPDAFLNKNREKLRERIMSFFAHVLSRYLIPKDLNGYIRALFEKEELNERLALVLDHPTFIKNILGDSPKLTFADWKNIDQATEIIRKKPLNVAANEPKKSKQTIDFGNVDLETLTHGQFQVRSLITIPLWDAAKWKGVVIFGDGGFIGLSLAFSNIQKGREIFQDWRTKVGQTDVQESIGIYIIKGVSKHNPSWYRVIVSGALENGDFESGKLIVSTSRIHEMNPKESKNLDLFEREYSRMGKFLFCPSELQENGTVELLTELAIIKTKIIIKYAWQIGLADIEQAAIYEDDDPMIPDGVTIPPVMEVIKKKKT